MNKEKQSKPVFLIIKKRCSGCGKIKVANNFNKRLASKDKLQSKCKLCIRDYYLLNHEKIENKKVEWFRKNPEYKTEWRNVNKDKIVKYVAKYRKANRNKLIRWSLEWRNANKDKARIFGRRWRNANKDKTRDYMSCRQARKRGAFVENVERQVVYKRDKEVCHICGKRVKSKGWHLDHIIPLIKGGEHSYRNVAVSHPQCNLQKGVKLVG